MKGNEDQPGKPDINNDPFSMQNIEIRDEESPFVSGKAVRSSPQVEGGSSSGSGQTDELQQKEPSGSASFVPTIAIEAEEDFAGIVDWQGDKKQWKLPTLGWFVFAGLMVFVGAGAVKFFLADKVDADAEFVVIEEELEWSDKQLVSDEVARQMIAKINEAARGYFGARSIEQKLAYSRHADRVRPLMEHYYQEYEITTGEFDYFNNFQALDIGGLPFVFAAVVMRDGGRNNILLEQRPDGSFMVDWESDVCYQPIAWDEFISKQPTEGLMMRVYAEPDSFYAYEFSDEGLYDCYKLRARGSREYIFGYLQKTSEAGRNMRDLFAKTRKLGVEKPEPLILLLRFPQESRSSKAVHIDRVVAPRWVLLHEEDAKTRQ